MSWYRLATEFMGNEFTGVDGIMDPHEFIQQTKVRNIENEFLSPPLTSVEENIPKICPICKQEIVDSEIMRGYHNADGEIVFKCNNCGYTNSSNVQVITKKRKKSDSDPEFLKTANPIVPSPSAGSSSYNSMNTPYGRVDLSEDERIIPWERLDDSFANEFVRNRQKENRVFKVIKVKGKGGKTKKIIVKMPNLASGFVGPQNVTMEKGRFRKQPRYNPEQNKGEKKDAPGGWPQMRNPTKGFYGQSDDTYTFDADMRHRVIPWKDLINDRSTQMLTLTKPI